MNFGPRLVIKDDVVLFAGGDRTMRAFSKAVSPNPQGYTQLLLALDFAVGPAREIVVAGRPGAQDTEAMLAALHREFLPNKVVLFRPEGAAGEIAELAPFTRDQEARDGKATAYVCENFACKAPTTDIEAMLALVRGPDPDE